MPENRKSISAVSQVRKSGKIHIRPTRYGWIFLVVVFSMLAGSINYNNNLGFLFTFLLASMGFVSLIHSFRNFSDLRIESVQTWPVFERQTAMFQIHLGKISASHIGIRFRLAGSETAEADLTPKGRNRRTLSIPAYKRGVIKPSILVVDSIYPFGIVRFSAEYDVGIVCFVYPKPVPVHQLTPQDLIQAHAKEEKLYAEPDDFKGLKSYQQGDPIQHIFWKAYSRGQGLMIKEFSASETPSLLFSWYKIKEDTTEKKLSLMCAMILKAHGLNLKYGLKLPGRIIEPGMDERHKHKCLEALALF